jgi:tRNA 2-thiouridine synthesizing protein A
MSQQDQTVMTASFHADAEWDAGDIGCGQLVLDLRNRLKAMPGGVLKVIALDAGAPEDLPAWCRLTRNELLRHDAAEQSFWIRSRMDWT